MMNEEFCGSIQQEGSAFGFLHQKFSKVSFGKSKTGLLDGSQIQRIDKKFHSMLWFIPQNGQLKKKLKRFLGYCLMFLQ